MRAKGDSCASPYLKMRGGGKEKKKKVMLLSKRVSYFDFARREDCA